MLASYIFYVYKCAHKTLVPSSSGLGHRPLTAVTRVRVSLGSPIKNPPFMGGFFIGDMQLELERAGSEFDNKREAHGGVPVSNISRTSAVATQAIYGAE